ncbi:MAG: hypothetical protein GY821_12810 [Gammaproteobacteria bacterium]|nr:hypothetical protein [Gammaproteobacteria bacterium]
MKTIRNNLLKFINAVLVKDFIAADKLKERISFLKYLETEKNDKHSTDHYHYYMELCYIYLKYVHDLKIKNKELPK